MRILVIGGTGTIGSAVVDVLQERGHDVTAAGRSSGDERVDITDQASIGKLFRDSGQVDALVSCAGSAAFGALDELSDEDFELCLRNKMMGQVNLLREGMPSVADGGSITLTSGLLAWQPAPGGAAISMVNAGLEGFVRAAALEMPRGIRVNVVSPPWVSETLESMGRDPKGGLPARKVANAYLESVQGSQNGKTLDARDYR